MAYKLNPLTGELDKVGDGASVKEKLNPVTGDFNLVEEASSYKQIFNPLSGKLQLFSEGGGGEVLPAGYARLEYIESTGTQYIDTGVSAPTITRFIVKGICYPNGGSNTQLLGGTSTSATTFFGARVMSGVHWYCMSDGGTSLGDPENLSTIDCTINSNTSQTGTLVDHVAGTTTDFAKFATNTWAFSDENLLIFGGGETRVAPSAACYGLKLYVGETLVRDLVPVERYDGVYGLYDLVNGVFYYNQGTGNFVPGPYVLPEDYIQNEYYETKGVAGGVDTGIKPTYNMAVKGKYSVFHNSSIYILGARASQSEQGLTKPQTMTFSGSQNGGTVTAFAGGGSVVAKTNGTSWVRVSGEENKYEIDVSVGNYVEGESTIFTANFYDLINEISDEGETNSFSTLLDEFTPTIHLGGNGTDTENSGQRIYFLDLAWGTERRRYVPATQGEITGFYEVFTHEFIS